MKAKSFTYFLIISFSFSIAACSSTAKLSSESIHTSTKFQNKLPLKTAVYIPNELTNKKIKVTAASECNVWWKDPKVSIGNSYITAINNGLSSAIQSVNILKSPPSETANMDKYDLLIAVEMLDENASISHNTGAFKTSLNSQFEVSFTLTFKKDGQTLYSSTVNGSAFNKLREGCSKMAESIKNSIGSALVQLTNNIAQTTHNSSQLSGIKSETE
jgi:hypothetical protein